MAAHRITATIWSAGRHYTIEVHGKDENGVPLPPVTCGPLQFAENAVGDIDVKLQSQSNSSPKSGWMLLRWP
jgi:hypothetical protein